MRINITLDDGTLIDVIRLTDEEAGKLVDDRPAHVARRLVFAWEIHSVIRRALRYKTAEEHAEEARHKAYARAVEGIDDK